MWVNGLVPGGFLAGSVRLITGGCMADQSFLILKQLGEALKAMGQPFVLGGDWGMPPETLIASGWPAAVGGSVVCTGSYSRRGSGTSSSWHCLD
eukprot:6757043-Pyramimonas_sp.AAC.1